MSPIAFLKKTNTVLVFVLLIAALLSGGYFIAKSRKPISTIHISVDSVHLHKQ